MGIFREKVIERIIKKEDGYNNTGKNYKPSNKKIKK